MVKTFLFLIICSIIMGLSSYGVGILPVAATLSSQKMRSISVFGMGVLMGTSLTIIIPEGIETLYGSDQLGSVEDAKRKRKRAEDDLKISITEMNAQSSPEVEMNEPVIENSPASTTISHSFSVGLSLLCGFVMMYLMDHSDLIIKSFSGTQRKYVGLNEDNFEIDQTTNFNGSIFHKYAPAKIIKLLAASPTTLGLVVHSLADGVALGSSIATSNTTLSSIIFLALVIHKLPASFGLGAVLTSANLSISVVRFYLICFSIAAPLSAIITYSLLMIIGAHESSNFQWWTGCLLLFSGGTFLYVAIHVMQELLNDDHPVSAGTDSTISVGGNRLTSTELWISVIGMLVPSLVNFIKE